MKRRGFLSARALIVLAVIIANVLVGGIAYMTIKLLKHKDSFHLDNPEVNWSALEVMVTNEDKQQTLLGETPFKYKELTEDQIQWLIKEYYPKDIQEEYYAKYQRNFEEDFTEYAKLAYRVSSSGYRIMTKGYEYTAEDQALLGKHIVTDDLVNKMLDTELRFEAEKINYWQSPFHERTKFLAEVREPKFDEFKAQLTQQMQDAKAYYDKFTYTPIEGSLLDEFELQQSADYKEELIAKNKLIELNNDFTYNVEANQVTLFKNAELAKQVEGLKSITTEELARIFDLGVEGLYKFDVEAENSSNKLKAAMDYISENGIQLNIYVQGEDVQTLADKYNGFATGSLKSGCTYRLSHYNDTVILEIAYIPEITGKLKMDN